MFHNISLLIKLFFIAIFFYVISKIDYSKISLDLFHYNFLIAFICFLLFHLLRAYKIKIMLNIKKKLTTKIYFIGFFFGFITPGRIGDFLKIFYIKRKNKFLTFKFFFYDKIIDIFWISFFSFISLLHIINTNKYYLLFMSYHSCIHTAVVYYCHEYISL